MTAPERVVVVGAGIAGVSAVTGMRAAGFAGEIVLVGAEEGLPYRRPPLSKELLRGEKTLDQLAIRPAGWYADQQVELLPGTPAAAVDPAARQVTLADGRTLAYDRLVLATGGRARRIGPDSPRIHTLRAATDVPDLHAALARADRLVVVGAGLVGSEIAASARSMGCEVTLLETAARPLPRLLPPDLGRMYADLHAAHGTELCTGVRIVDLVDKGDRVVVTAADGRSWSAPVVVVAVGMQPNAELAFAAGLLVDDGICVDGAGRTADPAIYAAGDVANRPEPVLGGRCRIEHWQGAQNHGTTVGRAVAGEAVDFAEVPWCWSDQYGHNLQVTGWPEAADRCVLRGDPADRRFTAFLTRADQLVGAVTMGRPADIRAARTLIGDRARVRADALADDAVAVADCRIG
ncbi:NAD(P)/FAD-dependent oxidoreductase [Micromonospora echinofusca]|uniref:FAD-dependent oxidoreductase n=1 Tax=Micromonospora echinofusca TaxID=47858 RepID=A0ABS3VMJ1_MICEH|nr:FAD-dependent oxidoreductase [Micromonospora echinofusca]MBO4205748.1 FAD-dependent oxidoreductase [Micromonospora echinofusca]